MRVLNEHLEAEIGIFVCERRQVIGLEGINPYGDVSKALEELESLIQIDFKDKIGPGLEQSEAAAKAKTRSKEEKAYYAQTPQYAAAQPQQQHNRPQPKKTSEDDRVRSDEARANAAIAAQKRAEVFEKSAGGRAAKKAIIAAKAPPPPRDNRDEPGLKWTMG